MMANRLFEGSAHAAAYCRFRPTTYPKELYEKIFNYMKARVPYPFGCAVDVGCGTGQSSNVLSQHFEKVIGIDISQAQIDKAREQVHPSNVSYCVASETKLPVSPVSVDLVTAAQAAHWFQPIEAFYQEAERVLKPDGCLALYGYGVPRLKHPTREEHLGTHFQEFDRYMWDGKYWNDQRRHIDNHYADFNLPYRDCERSDTGLEITYEWSLSHLIQFIGTWSSYQKYIKENPSGDALQKLQKRLHDVVGCEIPLEDSKITVAFPVFMLIGRKPND